MVYTRQSSRADICVIDDEMSGCDHGYNNWRLCVSRSDFYTNAKVQMLFHDFQCDKNSLAICGQELFEDVVWCIIWQFTLQWNFTHFSRTNQRVKKKTTRLSILDRNYATTRTQQQTQQHQQITSQIQSNNKCKHYTVIYVLQNHSSVTEMYRKK